MTISNSIWCAQHPNAGRNIQHTTVPECDTAVSVFGSIFKNAENFLSRPGVQNDDWFFAPLSNSKHWFPWMNL